MRRKLEDDFGAGTRLVWYVDPPTKTVRVHASLTESTLLTDTDILIGDPVMPGFRRPVRDWFERAGRRRAP